MANKVAKTFVLNFSIALKKPFFKTKKVKLYVYKYKAGCVVHSKSKTQIQKLTE